MKRASPDALPASLVRMPRCHMPSSLPLCPPTHRFCSPPTSHSSTQGPGSLEVVAEGGPARLVVFGGLPHPDQREIFWNFVSSSRERIAAAAKKWEALDREAFPPVHGEDNLDSIPLPRPYTPPSI